MTKRYILKVVKKYSPQLNLAHALTWHKTEVTLVISCYQTSSYISGDISAPHKKVLDNEAIDQPINMQ